MSDLNVNALAIARRLGKGWHPPTDGPDLLGGHGFIFHSRAERGPTILVSAGPSGDAQDTHDWTDWLHASISRPDRIPEYEDLTMMHAAVFGTGWAYQVFAPPAAHINIHARVLHLWGRLDGTPALPNFGALGSI